MEKRKLITVLSHKIVIDFAYFFTIFTFTLTDYWHDGRAYVNGSFRSGSFRDRSCRSISSLQLILAGPFRLLLVHMSCQAHKVYL